MLERILVVLLVATVSLAAWRLLSRRWLRARDPGSVEAVGYRPGRPAILYFTSPGCLPCEAVQKPELERLRQTFDGALQILAIDASAQPRLADAWGVLAVPTTFLIDARGRPRRVNHGPVRERELLAQLAAIGVAPRGLQSTSPEPVRGR